MSITIIWLNGSNVIEITDKHTGSTHRDIVYDDVQTFIDEIYTNKTENYTFNEIPRKDWTINDCINVTSELLADTNRRTSYYCEYHAQCQRS